VARPPLRSRGVESEPFYKRSGVGVKWTLLVRFHCSETTRRKPPRPHHTRGSNTGQSSARDGRRCLRAWCKGMRCRWRPPQPAEELGHISPPDDPVWKERVKTPTEGNDRSRSRERIVEGGLEPWSLTIRRETAGNLSLPAVEEVVSSEWRSSPC